MKETQKRFNLVIEALVLAEDTWRNSDLNDVVRQQARESINYYLKELSTLVKNGGYHGQNPQH